MRWHECTLQEIGKLARGRSRHRPRYAFHLYGGPYPFIQTGEIREAKKYINCYTQTYSEEGLKQSKIWPKGTLCITIAANIAEIGILDFDACFPDSVLGFIPNQDKADLNFIYYTLIHYKRELQYLGEGSVQDNINLGTFENIKFPIPSLPEQRAIAAVLSSLDDKINLLHRQNATLEAMAEALFRQWFVVEAKEEWEEKPLSEIASFLNGLPCQKYRPQNLIEKLPVLKIRELSNGISIDSEWASSTVPQEYIVQFGDVIFSWSGSLMIKMWDGENCVLNQHLFKVNSNNYPKWFYYFWCRQHLKEFISISESKATTMGHIKRGDLDAAIVKVPNKKEIYTMSDIIEPYLNKLMQNKAQITTLEKLRDTLLPKLMSGEVRVAY